MKYYNNVFKNNVKQRLPGKTHRTPAAPQKSPRTEPAGRGTATPRNLFPATGQAGDDAATPGRTTPPVMDTPRLGTVDLTNGYSGLSVVPTKFMQPA